MSTQWFYSHAGREMLGPCTPAELKELAATGRILPTDRVRKTGMEKAVRARRVKGLFVAPAGPESSKPA